MTEFFNRPSNKQQRRELRSNMQASEVLLWARLKAKQVQNCKFRSQFSAGPFILDFYAPEIKLGFEVDGDSHFELGAQEKDLQRQAYLESAGVRVMRFQNTDIWENMDWVLDEVTHEIERRRTQ
jgi:very-short-patch-repair endonuclease